MAKVYIRGNPQKVGKEVIRECSKFFLNHLLGRLSKNITVYINVIDNLYQDMNLYGDVMPISDNRLPRKFTVRIDSSLGYKKMIVSLAHECVHIKQYARKELGYGNGGWLWNGVLYAYDKCDYWELPHEIEAIGREPGLYIKWAFFSHSGLKAA
ncbi:MAG: hypothetical protein P4L79_10515 [Legionella sp.]|uniref:hypothetical protein n=1 Tax=Legionella sp. TaxID=459 RepID=UPI00284E326E|nr:hypothetical protein [Legionella sp.]